MVVGEGVGAGALDDEAVHDVALSVDVGGGTLGAVGTGLARGELACIDAGVVPFAHAPVAADANIGAFVAFIAVPYSIGGVGSGDGE